MKKKYWFQIQLFEDGDIPVYTVENSAWEASVQAMESFMKRQKIPFFKKKL